MGRCHYNKSTELGYMCKNVDDFQLGYMCKNVDDFQQAWDGIQGAVVKQVRNLWFS